MEYVIKLSDETHRATITVELRNRPCDVAPYLTIDGESVGDTYTELSICADISELTSRGFWRESSGGQCINEVRRLFGDLSKQHLIAESVRDWESKIAGVSELCDIWERWHLNGLQTGSRAQMEALKSPEFDPRTIKDRHGAPDYYASACAYLKERGLNPDPGMIIPAGTHMEAGPYSYGHAWLVEKIPAEVEARIKELCELLLA